MMACSIRTNASAQRQGVRERHETHQPHGFAPRGDPQTRLPGGIPPCEQEASGHYTNEFTGRHNARQMDTEDQMTALAQDSISKRFHLALS